jgi:GNAT superfamily N-acetyltransferase
MLRLWRRIVHRLRQRVRAMGGTERLGRIMYVCDLPDRPPAMISIPGVEFRELSSEEIRSQAADFDGGAVASGSRALDGAACVVGVIDGRQVYRFWYVRRAGDQIHGAPSDWRPRGRVLFLHGGYTEPAFRGRGIHTAGVQWLLDRERGSGVAHALCVVHADNFMATRAVERVGFRSLGRIE